MAIAASGATSSTAEGFCNRAAPVRARRRSTRSATAQADDFCGPPRTEKNLKDKGPDSTRSSEKNQGLQIVGARGFEPPTTCTPSKCATRLRYAPKTNCLLQRRDALCLADHSGSRHLNLHRHQLRRRRGARRLHLQPKAHLQPRSHHSSRPSAPGWAQTSLPAVR